MTQYVINEFGYIVLMVCCIVCYAMHYPFAGRIAIGVGLLLFFYLIYRFCYMASILYVVTGEQLIFQHGVFSHSTEYIELYRISDYQQKRSFVQQLFGLKTVVILSSDRTTPALSMAGLRDEVHIVPEIRTRVEYNKIRRGVYEIANRY